MKYLTTGNFCGKKNGTLNLAGITVTDNDYTDNFSDWHYHENPYFAFVISGNLIEGNKKETYHCSAGSLLFHNRHEPHYNSNPTGFMHDFHLEIDENWLNRFEIDLDNFSRNADIKSPSIKLLFHNIYKETKLFDNASDLTINALLVETFETMRRVEILSDAGTPAWVKRLDEILHDNLEKTPSLQDLSNELSIHSVHLCRYFRKYFRCSFGKYIRQIRVEKALSMLHNQKLSLTEIAFECGFADQSHFIRCFKEFNGLSPKEFRKLLTK